MKFVEINDPKSNGISTIPSIHELRTSIKSKSRIMDILFQNMNHYSNKLFLLFIDNLIPIQDPQYQSQIL